MSKAVVSAESSGSLELDLLSQGDPTWKPEAPLSVSQSPAGDRGRACRERDSCVLLAANTHSRDTAPALGVQ